MKNKTYDLINVISSDLIKPGEFKLIQVNKENIRVMVDMAYDKLVMNIYKENELIKETKMEAETKQRKQRAPTIILAFLVNEQGMTRTISAANKKELNEMLRDFEGYKISSLYKAHELQFSHKVVSTLEF